jgi:hypothetical protein
MVRLYSAMAVRPTSEARRHGSAPVVGRFSVADARAASLWGKAGPWKQYPQRMLQMRARGFALRDDFADLLRGVMSAGEARDIPRGMPDVTPPAATDVAAELAASQLMRPFRLAPVSDTGMMTRPTSSIPWRAFRPASGRRLSARGGTSPG